MQGEPVQSLVQEDPTCHEAAKPVYPIYWDHEPTAYVQHQEKPIRRKQEWPPLAASGESPHKEMKTQLSQK